MSGQSSQLTLSEARAMQERVQASGSHAKAGKKSGNKGGKHEQHTDTADAHNHCK